MLLQLKKYSLTVKYKKGSDLFLADTLSRAYLPEVRACSISEAFEEIDHTMALELPKERLQQFEHMPADDSGLQELRKTLQCGWPERKADIPKILYLYYDFRDDRATSHFKGHR
jgi:hypothetical protein